MDTGSPCPLWKTDHLCTSCKEWLDEPWWRYKEVSAPSFQSSKDLLAVLTHYQQSPVEGFWTVIFIDEAHSLARFRQTTDNLLKMIEDAPARVVYILATSQLDELPNALKSRFPLLPVRPLTISDSRNFQKNILSLEKIKDYNLKALDLISGLSMYQPRDILNNLEKVIPLPVIVENVRRVFGGSDLDRLMRYFECLASGNSEDAIAQFLDWPEANSVKIELIKSFILLVYYRDLSGVDVIIDPLVNSIEDFVTSKIVESFRRRVEDAGSDFHNFWLGLVEFWQGTRQDDIDEVVLLSMTLFHRIASNLESSSATISQALKVPVRKSKDISVKIDDLLGSKYLIRRRNQASPLPNYLEYEQVREILNTASICIQAYGSQFNTKLTLFHRRFNITDSRLAAKNMSKFVKGLNDWFKRRGCSVIPRITVQENDPDQGFCARNILSLAPDCHDDFQQWCSTWSEGQGAVELPAIEMQIPGSFVRADKRRDKSRHQECVSWLIAGMNPAEKDQVQRLGPSGYKPLHELIDLRATLRVAGSIGGEDKHQRRQRRHASSNVLDPSVLAKQVRHKMFFLSAFNDGAWKDLWGDWQLDEYDARQHLLKERDRAWNDALSEDREQLEASWLNDPRKRQRHWKGWWT